MAETTIVEFGAMPSCAANCGPLYDVNGACVPPAAPTADAATYDSCFCADSRLTAFQTASTGICDSVCATSDLSGIQSWYNSFCQGKAAAATSSAATSSSSAASSSGKKQGGGGDWLSTHWQWVIMIVIVVVGIAGIWVGACIWRRKYLKKKDRLYELGKGLPSTVAVNTQGNLVGPGARDSTISQPGMFMSGSGGAAEKPKKERKKWNVTQRT
ncbi:hypothetical protein F4778DRAFT_106303 [Xylariomycetidae sp. FL2044]|nr:hypothetical protein F4778DRAFT_106303 [Xylariomycetidae sp. FL2044]